MCRPSPPNTAEALPTQGLRISDTQGASCAGRSDSFDQPRYPPSPNPPKRSWLPERRPTHARKGGDGGPRTESGARSGGKPTASRAARKQMRQQQPHHGLPPGRGRPRPFSETASPTGAKQLKPCTANKRLTRAPPGSRGASSPDTRRLPCSGAPGKAKGGHTADAGHEATTAAQSHTTPHKEGHETRGPTTCSCPAPLPVLSPGSTARVSGSGGGWGRAAANRGAPHRWGVMREGCCRRLHALAGLSDVTPVINCQCTNLHPPLSCADQMHAITLNNIIDNTHKGTTK
jgi:hypothetical protein